MRRSIFLAGLSPDQYASKGGGQVHWRASFSLPDGVRTLSYRCRLEL